MKSDTLKRLRRSLSPLWEEPAEDQSSGASARRRRSQAEAFVLMVTVEVLKRSGAMEGQTLERWAQRSQILIQKVMEGLTLEPGSAPNPRRAGAFAREVRGHLDRTFRPAGVRQLLARRDPRAEAAMVRYIRLHIQDQCGGTWSPLISKVLASSALFVTLFLASAFCMLV